MEASSLDALYNGNIIGDRIITADPARQRNTTLYFHRKWWKLVNSTIGGMSNKEASNRSTVNWIIFQYLY